MSCGPKVPIQDGMDTEDETKEIAAKKEVVDKKEIVDIPPEPLQKPVSPEQRTLFFTLNLFVAAVGEGNVLPDSGRRKHGVLEQILRNVSKEQNIVVKLGREGINRHIKMRVFVQNSIEAKAVIDYVSNHPDQASFDSSLLPSLPLLPVPVMWSRVATP